MNKLLYSLLAVLFFFSSASAKIWRVNNNNGINADFTTLQAAHNGATSGDTIHLEGSPNNYGGLTCTKKLTIIGPGYFLDENANTQAFFLTAKVSTIYFNVGSAGSTVMGLDFLGDAVYVRSNDIFIKRNKFTGANGTTPDYYTGLIHLSYLSNNTSVPVTNVFISQNYGIRIDINNASTGILIANNFIAFYGYAGEATTGTSVSMQANAVALLQNNIFRRGQVNVNNSTLANNIMYTGTLTGTANLISNNIGSTTQFGTSNGNQSNITMSTVFALTGSTDAFWKLKAGSPAIGAGYGSTTSNPIDAGIFSGYTPYVLSGLPPVPSIYYFANQPVGSSSDPIDVSIKVKSNN